MPDDERGGFTLREAIQHFSDPEQWEEFSRLQREAPKGPIAFQSVYVYGDEARNRNFRASLLKRQRLLAEAAEKAVLSAFRENLECGDLVAVGMFVRPKLSLEPEVVSRFLWSSLTPNFGASSAENEDIRVTAIRIYTADSIAALGASQPEAAQDASTEGVEPYRTGLPGRPTAAHLVRGEFLQRADHGSSERTLSAEARALRAWLEREHPGIPLPSHRTIENHIRADFRKRHPTKFPTK